MPSAEKSVPPTSDATRSSCPVARVTAFAGRLAATADPSRKSAWWLAAAVLAIVATCEFVVMLVLALFPSLPAWQEAIADALLLSLIAAPLLWFVTRGVARRLDSAARGRLL